LKGGGIPLEEIGESEKGLLSEGQERKKAFFIERGKGSLLMRVEGNSSPDMFSKGRGERKRGVWSSKRERRKEGAPDSRDAPKEKKRPRDDALRQRRGALRELKKRGGKWQSSKLHCPKGREEP